VLGLRCPAAAAAAAAVAAGIDAGQWRHLLCSLSDVSQPRSANLSVKPVDTQKTNQPPQPVTYRHCTIQERTCSAMSFRALRKQEAQLPLRNRASAMHFFVAKLLSVAVMTYCYVYHFRNLRLANLLRTQRTNFSMRPQYVRITRDPTVVWQLDGQTSRRWLVQGLHSRLCWRPVKTPLNFDVLSAPNDSVTLCSINRTRPHSAYHYHRSDACMHASVAKIKLMNSFIRQKDR